DLALHPLLFATGEESAGVRAAVNADVGDCGALNLAQQRGKQPPPLGTQHDRADRQRGLSLLRRGAPDAAPAAPAFHRLAGDAREEQGRVPREILLEMGALGLLGMRYAPQFGGQGLDTLANAVLAEELGRSTYGGFAVTVLVHTDMASPHLHHAGSRAQLERSMPDITAGRKIPADAMTEADAGSDLASMRTSARKIAGGYLINGAKMFITNGVNGDLVFVAAKSGEPGRNRQMTMFAVEKGTAGFRVARALKKQGWLSSDTAELVFEDCFVPDANVIGAEGQGFTALVKNLPNERIVFAAQALGEAMKAIELPLDWVKQRRAFGAPLWDKQVIRQRLSMRLGQVEAARALLFNTAWRDARDENVVKEVSMLKALAGTLVNEVLYD